MAAKRKKILDKTVATRFKLLKQMVRAAKTSDEKLGAKLEAIAVSDTGTLADAVEITTKALNGKTIAGRLTAADVLGHGAEYATSYGGGLVSELRDALPAIIDAASGKNEEVRIAAIRALAGFAPDAADEVVRAIVDRDLSDASESEAEATIDAIQACGPDEATAGVSWLANMLNHSSAEIRSQACDALGWLGQDAVDAVGAIAHVAGSDPERRTRQRAVRALVQIDPGGDVLRQTSLPEGMRDAILAGLRSLGSRGRSLRRNLKRAWIAVGSSGNASGDPAEVSSKGSKQPPVAKTRRRRGGPATLRNLMFLKWYEDPEATTCHSPAKIRDKWNEENEREHVGAGNGGRDIVEKGIKAARSYLKDSQLGLDEAIEERRGEQGKS